MRADVEHEGLTRARAIRLAYQIKLSRREALEFHLVGAERAYRHWAKRAARLQARLDRLT